MKNEPNDSAPMQASASAESPLNMGKAPPPHDPSASTAPSLGLWCRRCGRAYPLETPIPELDRHAQTDHRMPDSTGLFARTKEEAREGSEDLALAAARGGEYVYPIDPKTNRPLNDGGRKSATRDPDRIRQWWEKWPRAAVGATDEKPDEPKKPAAKTPERGGNAVPYFEQGNQTFWTKPSRDGGSENVRLAYFAARITQQVTEDDGSGAPGRTEFLIEGRADDGTTLRAVHVPADVFNGMKWPVAMWGNRAILAPGNGVADRMRAAIQLLSPDVKEVTRYTHTGWRVFEGERVFLHGGGALGAHGNRSDVVVVLDEQGRDQRSFGPMRFPTLPEAGSPEAREAVRAALGVIDLGPDTVTVPIFGAVWRSVLCEVAPAAFMLHIVGPSGHFKTQVAMLAQSFFGAGYDERTIPTNWSASANYIEKMSFRAKDVVTVVDEFVPTGGRAEREKLHAAADRVARMTGNLGGRGRLSSDASTKGAYFPRGILLSTGEEMMQGTSCRARALAVMYPAGCVESDALTRKQREAARGAYATAMGLFIQWLAPRLDAMRGELAARVDELRAQMRAAGHRRTFNSTANLAAGWEVALRFALDAGAISQEERDALWARLWAAFAAFNTQQASYVSEEKPASVFFQCIGTAVRMGRAHFTDKNGAAPRNPERYGWVRKLHLGRADAYEQWEPKGDRIGVVPDGLGDEGTLLLDGQAAWTAAQAMAQHQGIGSLVRPSRLFPALREDNLLVSREASRDRLTVRRSAWGSRHDFLHVHEKHVLRGVRREGADLREFSAEVDEEEADTVLELIGTSAQRADLLDAADREGIEPARLDKILDALAASGRVMPVRGAEEQTPHEYRRADATEGAKA